MEHLHLRRIISGVPTTGSGVNLKAEGHATLRSVRIGGFFDNIRVDSAYDWDLDDCYLVNAQRYGVYISDIASTDQGDQRIIAVTFDNVFGELASGVAEGATTATLKTGQGAKFTVGQTVYIGTSTLVEPLTIGEIVGDVLHFTGGAAHAHLTNDPVLIGKAAIRYESGGGLKMTASKLLHHQIALDCAPLDGVATSVMALAGNSYENQNNVGLKFVRAASTGTFKYISISGGEMSVQGDGIRCGAGIEDVSIGNGLVMHGTGGLAGVDLTGGAGYEIDGVLFDGWNNAIQVGESVLNPRIGVNLYRNCTNTVKDNSTCSVEGNKVGTTYHDHRRQWNNITSTGTVSKGFEIAMLEKRGCVIDLQLEGAVTGATSGNNSVARVVKLLLRRPVGGGNCVVETVSDNALGIALTLSFDVTTTSGTLIIGLHRSAEDGTSGGTPRFDGTMTIQVRGHAEKVKVL